MNGRALTGAALAAALRKAAAGVIAGAVERNARRLAATLDAALGGPSPPLQGRAGQGRAGEGRAGEGDPGRSRTKSSMTVQAANGVPLPTSPARGDEKESHVVIVRGENLFAREFGALDTPADPVVGPAIERLRRRPA